MAEAEEMGAEEEVVVRLASMPQIISSESIVGGVGGGAGGAARASTSAGVELGRRLLLAARAGDTPTVLELMAQGAPFTTDWLGTSPLHLAAWGGHAGTCGVLLRAGVSRDARTKVERTPLHLAAHAGHAAVATVLLDHGAMIDCRDMLRMTPLHWACARGHGALAALLARRGADVRARCKFRRSPLQLAARLPPVLAALRQAVQEREDARAVQGVCAAGDVHVQRVGVAGDVHVQRVGVAGDVHVQHVSVQGDVHVQRVGAAGDVHVQRVCAVGNAHAAGAVAMQEEAAEPDQKAPADDKPAIKIQHKINKPNLENERGGGGGGGAAALLRQHGITLLPADDGSTVLSALQSGRTVVLSDAGKLMLKENSTPAPPAPAPAPARAGVVLRACPARSPPRPGVKVFTVNKLPHTRSEPQDVQIKYVQLPGEATLLSPHKAAMKAKSKLARAAPAAGAGAAGAGAGRPGVKIIMNKASFSKLLATASRAHGAGDNEPLSLSGSRGEAVVCVPEQFVRSSSARYLRAQLLAAHAALAELQRELGQARAALAAQQPGG